MKERTLAAFALTNRLTDRDVDPLTARSFWPLLTSIEGLETLLGLSEQEMAQKVISTDLDPGRLVRLLDIGVGLANHLTTLDNRGIGVLTGCDDGYPDRLKKRLQTAAPPLLYFAGDQELLKIEGIGVVGSRDVSPEGGQVAKDAATRAVTEGMPLTSGGARGVDQLSMAAAFEAGGNVVGVLADSLEKFLSHAENRSAVSNDRALLCTPYNPSSGFSVGNAMGRNKIIYGLSRVTLVVATDYEAGGTWAGATEAIRRDFGSVAVWTGQGQGPGNEALAAAGATAIGKVDQLSAIGPIAPVHNEQPAFRFDEN